MHSKFSPRKSESTNKKLPALKSDRAAEKLLEGDLSKYISPENLEWPLRDLPDQVRDYSKQKSGHSNLLYLAIASLISASAATSRHPYQR